MIRLLLTLLLLSFEAGAATTYIDPTCTNNGDGTGQSCAASGGAAGAFNTWASQTTWTGNAKAYQRAGTTFTGACQFLINASGADTNNRIEISTYGGSGRAIVNCTSGNYAFGWAARNYITVSNLDFRNSANNCLYLSGGTGNIITGNKFTSCAGYGISLDGASLAHDHDSLTISNNDFAGTTNSAILADITTTNTATWAGVTISGNTFGEGVVSASSGPVIGLRQTTTPIQNTIQDVQIYDNVFAGTNYADASPSNVIIVGRSSLPATPSDQSLCAPDSKIVGLKIYNNTFSRVGGNPIYVNNVTTSATYPDALIYGNRIEDALANAGIISFYSTGLKTYQNTISGIAPLSASSYIDGIGIDYDICNVGGEISRNRISGAVGYPSVANSGQGIALFGSNSVKVRSNVIWNGKIGISLGNDLLGAAGTANDIDNNTINNMSADCVESAFTVEQVNNFRNNSISGCGGYGMNFAGTGQQVLSNNGISGTTSGAINSNNDDAAKVTADPAFLGGSSPTTAEGFLPTNTALFRTGTRVGDYADFRGCRFSIPPSIGAYEMACGRTTTDRSAASRSAVSRTAR